VKDSSAALVARATLTVAALVASLHAQGGPYERQKVDPAAATRGRAVYAQACINCHGSTAKGTDRGPDLIRSSAVLRDRLGSGIVVIASETDGKVALVVSVTKDLTSRIQAGRIVKEIAPIVGGGGGGRPDFAEAGGKDPSRIDELLAKAPDLIGTLL